MTVRIRRIDTDFFTVNVERYICNGYVVRCGCQNGKIVAHHGMIGWKVDAHKWRYEIRHDIADHDCDIVDVGFRELIVMCLLVVVSTDRYVVNTGTDTGQHGSKKLPFRRLRTPSLAIAGDSVDIVVSGHPVQCSIHAAQQFTEFIELIISCLIQLVSELNRDIRRRSDGKHRFPTAGHTKNVVKIYIA